MAIGNYEMAQSFEGFKAWEVDVELIPEEWKLSYKCNMKT
jgi:hypothetical protein